MGVLKNNITRIKWKTKMKVLIVDAALTVRTMIKNILEPEGFDVYEAANGAIALNAIREH